jgi:hypothetical protein
MEIISKFGVFKKASCMGITISSNAAGKAVRQSVTNNTCQDISQCYEMLFFDCSEGSITLLARWEILWNCNFIANCW